jgi:hypothetical protein
MKVLFTLHAGEVIAGDYIERKYKRVQVWVPTKDTGIDLLVTGKNKKTLSLQVKYSRDFLAGLGTEFQKPLRACGWWTLYRQKIERSPADYWIFVLAGFERRSTDFIIITPAELLRRLDAIYPKKLNICHTYIWVTEKKKCWATRGLKKTDQSLIAQDKFKDVERDFGDYLNNWSPIKDLNGL